MLLQMLGGALIGFGLIMLSNLKKNNDSFDLKSRRGKMIVMLLVMGLGTVFIPSGTLKSDDYLSIAAPNNAPWENHLTKKEAKSISKQTEKDIKDFKRQIHLKKSEEKRFLDGAYNIGKVQLITQELVFIGGYLSENTLEENNLNKKETKIMLDYVKKIKKPLVKSSELLNDEFEGFHFSNYVYSVELAREGLEKALELTYKNRSLDEIDDAITNDFLEYIESPSKFFSDGSIMNEFSEYYME